MNKISLIKKIATLTILFFNTGCGGGGGGEDTPNYSGAWNVNVDLVSNTCPRAIPEEFKRISALHNVNQNLFTDRSGLEALDIVLEDGADTYYGLGQLNQNGEGDSFSVTGTAHELPGFISKFTCIETIDYTYDSMNLEPDELNEVYASYVVRHSTIICTKGSDVRTCDVTYTGSAYGFR